MKAPALVGVGAGAAFVLCRVCEYAYSMAMPVDATATDSFLGRFFCPCSFSPCLLLLFTFVWFVVHNVLGPVLPLCFLPAASRAVHREKWRRWQHLRSLLARRDQQSLCSTTKASETQQQELASEPLLHQHISEKEGEQQQQPLLKQLQHAPEGEFQNREQALHFRRRTDKGKLEGRERVQSAAEQQQQQLKILQKSRPRDRFYESCSAAAASEQAWTVRSRDDAGDAATDEEEELEENDGLRRRVTPGGVEEAAEFRTATEVNEGVDAPRREASTAGRSAGARGAVEMALPTSEENAAAGEESTGQGEGGLAAAAGYIVAAAAEEGAAAVAGESAETAAVGEENDAAQKWKEPAESEEEELQLLEKYFVLSSANVVGMLHALYLAPAALYYSIRNVVLPAAELVLAERAAAAATPEDTTSGHATPAAAFDSELLLSYHHLCELLHIYFLHWEKAPSFWDGSTDCIVILSAYVMTSYFVWDTVECFQHMKVHGRAYFIHALLSLLAGLLQVSARGIRLAGICSMFAVSEISTPSLHFRWFLIHSGQGSSRLCTMTTVWTVFLFILVRTVMVPCLVFSHYWGDLVFFRRYTLREEAKISVLRALFMLALTAAWTVLNLFWCFLFFRTLCKRQRRGNCSGGGRKQCIPGCRAHSRKSSVQPSSNCLRQQKV